MDLEKLVGVAVKPISICSQLSFTAASCLFTTEATSAQTPLQKVPGAMYTHPPEGIRKLAAKLIIEEALELVNALGFLLIVDPANIEAASTQPNFKVTPHSGYDAKDRDLFDVIDGACDTSYVATWILCAYGVPDRPHMLEVCRANDDKFPQGKAVVREDGKFLKPEGWKGPDHKLVRDQILSEFRTDAMREEALCLYFNKVADDINTEVSGKL